MTDCRACGAAVAEDWRFCRECGTPSEAPAPSAPAEMAGSADMTAPVYAEPATAAPTRPLPPIPAASFDAGPPPATGFITGPPPAMLERSPEPAVPRGPFAATGLLAIAAAVSAAVGLAIHSDTGFGSASLFSVPAIRVVILAPAVALLVGGLLSVANDRVANFGAGLVVGAGATLAGPLPAFLHLYSGGHPPAAAHALTAASSLAALAAIVAVAGLCIGRRDGGDWSIGIGVIGGVCAVGVPILSAFKQLKFGTGVLEGADGFTKAAFFAAVIAAMAVLIVVAAARSASGRAGALLGFAAATGAGYAVFPLSHLPASAIAPAFWFGVVGLAIAALAGLTLAFGDLSTATGGGTTGGLSIAFVLVAILTVVLAGQHAQGGGLLGDSLLTGATRGSTTDTTDTTVPSYSYSSDNSTSNKTPDTTYETTPTTTRSYSSSSHVFPTSSSEQVREDIQDTLLTFHEDIVRGDYQSAWNLLSTRKQQQALTDGTYDKWVTNQQTLGQYLDPTPLHVEIQQIDSSTQEVRVMATGMTWSKPGAKCAEWSGVTWALFEDGGWRYDPGYSTTPERTAQWKSRFAELLGGRC